MKKLQQFYIMKFSSTRLDKFNYHLKRFLGNKEGNHDDRRFNIRDIRQNGELIALADNQALRIIRDIRYDRHPDIIKYNQEDLEQLYKDKKEIRRKQANGILNKDGAISEIMAKNAIIDEMLFVPEYVSVVIDDINHYRKIIRDGLYINNYKYVRLMCSAGQARVNTVILIREDYESDVKKRLRCGAKRVKITKNKYNAYFALSSSATYQIPKPNIYLIDDCEIEMDKDVDWISKIPPEKKNGMANNECVSKEHKTLPFNFFDGCGAVSPEFAQRVADELDLDYLPSAFCIRCAYVKGMVFVIDFKKYAAKNGITTVTDLYGDEIDITKTDIILTKSQFKLWNGYDHMSDPNNLYPDEVVFDRECEINGFAWGVTKITPKTDDDIFRSNYQFCQAIKFKEEDLHDLCAPTVEWLSGVAGDDVNKTLLFLLGKLCNNPDTDFNDILNLTSDNIAKALMINPKMIKEEYIKSSIIMSINKKIKETYLGKLLLEGNFSVMIPDMYAFMQHAFHHKVTGALNDDEYFSNYWNAKNVDVVVAMRSPLTWRSEVNKLQLVQNDLTSEWFKYLKSGIIYNVWGCDCIIHADSDFDGDIVATTNNKVFIDRRDDESLPITYSKSTVDKEYIQERDLYKADIQSFNSTIGQITNISTSFYEILSLYEGKPGYERYEFEILNRLKLIRKSQGDAIDKAKGIKIEPMPKHWTKKVRNRPDDVSEEEFNFNNSIVADRKPYFFRYLYPKENAKYLEYNKRENDACRLKFRKSIDELLSSDRNTLTDSEIDYLENQYFKYMPLIDYNGRMNQICHYMENNLKEIQVKRRMTTPEHIIDLMLSERNVNYNEQDVEFMNEQYLEYKKAKELFRLSHLNDFQDSTSAVNEFNSTVKEMRQRISEHFLSIEYSCDLAIYICYRLHKSRTKNFCWELFGNQIIKNIQNNTSAPLRIPVLDDENGTITYLSKKYSVLEVNV